MLTFLDSSDRVAVGRALDLPVYFGDAGSREVKQIARLFMLVPYLHYENFNICCLGPS